MEYIPINLVSIFDANKRIKGLFLRETADLLEGVDILPENCHCKRN